MHTCWEASASLDWARPHQAEPCEEEAEASQQKPPFSPTALHSCPAPQGTGVTLGPNKGPSELLRPLASGGGVGRGSRSGRLLSPTQPCPAPSRKPLRWHCQGCRAFLRTVLAVLGFRRHCGQQISPRSVGAGPCPARPCQGSTRVQSSQ